MCGFVIVPDVLDEAISRLLDAAFDGRPDDWTMGDEEIASMRADARYQLLHYFNEHGRLPTITLEKKP